MEARNLVKDLQESYLRSSLRIMKIIPTEALEVALSITPLDLKIIYVIKATAYRLHCQGKWRNNGLGHTRLDFPQEHPFKQDRIPKKFQEGKPVKVRIPTSVEWSNLEIILNPHSEMWYTYGSGQKNCRRRNLRA